MWKIEIDIFDETEFDPGTLETVRKEQNITDVPNSALLPDETSKTLPFYNSNSVDYVDTIDTDAPPVPMDESTHKAL